MGDLLDLELERLQGIDHGPRLAELLISSDLSTLEWVDQWYGEHLRSSHFYRASERWTWYCLEHDRHLDLIMQHAWHLLPPLLAKRTLAYWLWFGIPPPRHDASELAWILLQPYFASKPHSLEIEEALAVAPNEETKYWLRSIA